MQKTTKKSAQLESLLDVRCWEKCIQTVLNHREIRLNTRTIEYERNCIEYNGNRDKEGKKEEGKGRPKATETEKAHHFLLFSSAEQLKLVPCKTGK